MLQAHRADDFDLLPPHLRSAKREAFAGTSRELYLAAPHLRFRQETGDVVLHLPVQPRRLLTPASSWVVGGKRTFAADDAIELPVQEFHDSPLSVDLCHLRPPFDKWSREIHLRPSDQVATQIFQLPVGRQHPFRLEPDSNVTQLPAGSYAVVVRDGATSNIHEGWSSVSDGCRWIEYESFPGQTALEILDTDTLTIRPREEATIVVSPIKGGGRLIDSHGRASSTEKRLNSHFGFPQCMRLQAKASS